MSINPHSTGVLKQQLAVETVEICQQANALRGGVGFAPRLQERREKGTCLSAVSKGNSVLAPLIGGLTLPAAALGLTVQFAPASALALYSLPVTAQICVGVALFALGIYLSKQTLEIMMSGFGMIAGGVAVGMGAAATAPALVPCGIVLGAVLGGLLGYHARSGVYKGGVAIRSLADPIIKYSNELVGYFRFVFQIVIVGLALYCAINVHNKMTN